jgi:flagellar motor switch protein FliM
MAESLSQEEIDALLLAVESGEIDIESVKDVESGKIVRDYDFRRPNKFSKDQLNTIELIYEDFCRSLGTLFSGLLRTRVVAKVGSVDQFTYDEFVQAIPNPTILNVFSFLPLEGKGILEINPIIGFSIIDRLFGGPGLSTVKGRPLTEIEKNVIERMSEKILVLFKDSWSICYEVNPFLEVIEINPQFTQVVSPTEMVVIITINIKIGEAEGLMNICLPCLMLEPIAEKLNTRFWFAGASGTSAKNYSQYLQQVIEKTEVPFSVVLGRDSIKIKEILELQTGDVIPLEKKKDSDVEVYVGSKLKFYGQVGCIGKKLAIKINKAFREGSD